MELADLSRTSRSIGCPPILPTAFCATPIVKRSVLSWSRDSNPTSPGYQPGAAPSLLDQRKFGTAGGNRTRVFCLEGRVLSLSDTAAWSTQRELNLRLRLGKAPCGHQHFGCNRDGGENRTRAWRFCRPPPFHLATPSSEEEGRVELPGLVAQRCSRSSRRTDIRVSSKVPALGLEPSRVSNSCRRQDTGSVCKPSCVRGTGIEPVSSACRAEDQPLTQPRVDARTLPRVFTTTC